MLEDSFTDNLRQAKVMMKYEFKKYFSGKKIAIFGVLMGLVLLLNIALPYLLEGGLGNDPDQLAYSMLSFIGLLILISATLFVSGTIVSEFEERTALVLFTKPIKKWSIFAGKVSAACILGFAFVLIYYAVVAVVSLIATGAISSALPISLGLALTYVIGTSGVAVLISSVVKKSSTAAILTFVVLLIFFTMITGILSMSLDPWFMLDEASNGILTCLSDEVCNAPRSAAVMLVWGMVTGLIGYAAFRNREF